VRDIIGFPIQSVLEELTIEIQITGLNAFAWRIWFAVKVFQIGGWISGCKIKIGVVE
jgi:hypothetical protein